MRRSLSAAWRIALIQLAFAGMVACGSRTGLFGEDDPFFSVTVTGDGGVTVTGDGGVNRDAFADAPPPLDVRPPEDVFRDDCPKTEKLLVYTITDTNELQAFNPETGQFRTISKISCPTTQPFAAPFSMAVNRQGLAYVLFNDEHLYLVDVFKPGAPCTNIPLYQPRQANFGLFGMGFSTDQAGPSETLFVAGVDLPFGNTNPVGAGGLASLSSDTFKLNFVSDFRGISKAELTGTGDGRLFAFYKKPDPKTGATADGPPSFIGEIDKKTADVVGERRFDTVDQGEGWAFSFWGGDFYMFHAPRGTTLVTRWRPSDDSVTQVATSSLKIVGAGVSTCAPQQ